LPASENLNFDATKHAELMFKLHERTKTKIERMNAKYQLAGDKGRKELKFEPGDSIWLHLSMGGFLNCVNLNYCLGLMDRLKW
jgi:hypothetical protein